MTTIIWIIIAWLFVPIVGFLLLAYRRRNVPDRRIKSRPYLAYSRPAA